MSPEKSEKQKRWEEIEAEVERIVDGAGRHIDQNIKETVVAFKACDINTGGSCEGHLDHGSTTAPWIDLADKEAMKMVGQIDWAKKPTTEQAIEERKMLGEVLEKKNLELCKRVMGYLEAFYRDRKISLDRQLVLQWAGQAGIRMESQGAELQKIADEETKKQKLLEYQEEMRAFTEFLKNLFFEPK